MARAGAPSRRKMITATVVRSTRLSPHFVRITIGGPELEHFEYQGLDQCIRLFFPRPGQSELRMPTAGNNGWIAQFFLIPSARRPYVRNYTVRDYRRDGLELDVDFVVHGDGPASQWAVNAAPGDPIGVFDEGTMYRQRPGAEWQLLVADESALPAAVAIAERTPRELPTVMYLEVPHRDDIAPVDVGENVAIKWLPREDAQDQPGALALRTVSQAHFPSGSPSVFIAGESGLATGLRRQLVAERGLAKPDITFYGYWKQGRAAIG